LCPRGPKRERRGLPLSRRPEWWGCFRHGLTVQSVVSMLWAGEDTSHLYLWRKEDCLRTEAEYRYGYCQSDTNVCQCFLASDHCDADGEEAHRENRWWDKSRGDKLGDSGFSDATCLHCAPFSNSKSSPKNGGSCMGDIRPANNILPSNCVFEV
jgi:hypothetical protein